MRRVLILYHSGVGNTKLIADLIEKFFRGEYITRILSVEHLHAIEEINSYDFFVIGFPTYHCTPSKTIRSFLNNLPVFTTPKRIFIFTTCGWYSGNTLRIFAKEAKVKNLLTVLSRSYRCPATDGLLLFPRLNCLARFEHKLVKTIERDVRDAQLRFSFEEKEQIPSFNLISILNYPNKIIGLKLAPLVVLNKDNCIRCRRCEISCYHRCFTLDEEGYLLYSNAACEHCYRCIHQCPQRALSIFRRRDFKQLDAKFYQGALRSLLK